MVHASSELGPTRAPWDWNRITSGCFALAWLAHAALTGGSVAFLNALLILVVPMACIWFSEELAGVTTTLPGPLSIIPINRRSPAIVVLILGWLALIVLTVLPVVIQGADSP